MNKHLARLKASGAISIEGASLILLNPETLRTSADALQRTGPAAEAGG